MRYRKPRSDQWRVHPRWAILTPPGHPIQSRDDRIPPSGDALPEGWINAPSKSRPDAVTYKYLKTGARTPEVPTTRNQEHFIAWGLQDRRAVKKAKGQKKSGAESSSGGEDDKDRSGTTKNQTNPTQKSGDPKLRIRELGDSDSLSDGYSSDLDHSSDRYSIEGASIGDAAGGSL